MTIAHRLPRMSVLVAALAVAVTPLANPLILALAVLSGGVLLACRCTADPLGAGIQVTDGDTVFRHYV